MWLAVIFSTECDDGATVLGVYSIKESAVKRLIDYGDDDDWTVVDDTDEHVSIGITHKRDKHTVLGQVIKMSLDNDTYFKV